MLPLRTPSGPARPTLRWMPRRRPRWRRWACPRRLAHSRCAAAHCGTQASSSHQALAPRLVAVGKPRALSWLRGQVRQKRRQARQRASPGGVQPVVEAPSESEPPDPPSAARSALRAPESAALRGCEPGARRSAGGGDVGEAPAARGPPGSGAADGALTCAEEAAGSARSGEDGAEGAAGESGRGAGGLDWPAPALARPEQWQQAYDFASGHLYYYREATQARPVPGARPVPRRPSNSRSAPSGLAAQVSPPPRACSPPPAACRSAHWAAHALSTRLCTCACTSGAACQPDLTLSDPALGASQETQWHVPEEGYVPMPGMDGAWHEEAAAAAAAEGGAAAACPQPADRGPAPVGSSAWAAADEEGERAPSASLAALPDAAEARGALPADERAPAASAGQAERGVAEALAPGAGAEPARHADEQPPPGETGAGRPLLGLDALAPDAAKPAPGGHEQRGPGVGPGEQADAGGERSRGGAPSPHADSDAASGPLPAEGSRLCGPGCAAASRGGARARLAGNGEVCAAARGAMGEARASGGSRPAAAGSGDGACGRAGGVRMETTGLLPTGFLAAGTAVPLPGAHTRFESSGSDAASGAASVAAAAAAGSGGTDEVSSGAPSAGAGLCSSPGVDPGTAAAALTAVLAAEPPLLAPRGGAEAAAPPDEPAAAAVGRGASAARAAVRWPTVSQRARLEARPPHGPLSAR